MLRLDNLLQTVSDKGNPDYVNENGPFPSTTSHWLGKGYYFWDGLMSRARWWGERHCGGKYMICQAWAGIDDNTYLDLAGNMQQLEQFKAQYDIIQKMHSKRKITISFAIHKLKKDKLFSYQAVRSLSNECGGDVAIRYVDTHKSFLNVSPPMQICVYSHNKVHDYHVIYPPRYVATGMI